MQISFQKFLENKVNDFKKLYAITLIFMLALDVKIILFGQPRYDLKNPTTLNLTISKFVRAFSIISRKKTPVFSVKV